MTGATINQGVKTRLTASVFRRRAHSHPKRVGLTMRVGGFQPPVSQTSRVFSLTKKEKTYANRTKKKLCHGWSHSAHPRDDHRRAWALLGVPIRAGTPGVPW